MKLRIHHLQQLYHLLKELEQGRVMLIVYFGLKLMKEHVIEPDDDYLSCEKIANFYLSELNADHRSRPLEYWQQTKAYLHNWLRNT